MDSTTIQEEALLLPDNEKALLAERLLTSLESNSNDLVQSWVDESRDRVAAYRSGDMEAIDGPSAMASLRDRFSR